MTQKKPLIEWSGSYGGAKVNTVSGAFLIVAVVGIVTFGVVLIN